MSFVKQYAEEWFSYEYKDDNNNKVRTQDREEASAHDGYCRMYKRGYPLEFPENRLDVENIAIGQLLYKVNISNEVTLVIVPFFLYAADSIFFTNNSYSIIYVDKCNDGRMQPGWPNNSWHNIRTHTNQWIELVKEGVLPEATLYYDYYQRRNVTVDNLATDIVNNIYTDYSCFNYVVDTKTKQSNYPEYIISPTPNYVKQLFQITIENFLDYVVENRKTFLSRNNSNASYEKVILSTICHAIHYAEDYDYDIIIPVTKTYTNSTWSTNKTWYIKVSWNGPSWTCGTGENSSNVVNYDTNYVTKRIYIRIYYNLPIYYLLKS